MCCACCVLCVFVLCVLSVLYMREERNVRGERGREKERARERKREVYQFFLLIFGFGVCEGQVECPFKYVGEKWWDLLRIKLNKKNCYPQRNEVRLSVLDGT